MTLLVLGAACAAFLVLLSVVKILGGGESLPTRLRTVGLVILLSAACVGLVYLLVR